MTRRLRILRMALFQFGFGLTSVMVLGVLNRVMFAELGLSAMLIGFLLAIPSIISPVRLWLGYLSDSHPLLGRRRTPYILAGTILAATGVFGGAWGALSIPRIGAGGVLIATVAFLTYGMGKNAMATAFQALIADVFDRQQRPQATAVLQAAFILGIVGGSVGLGRVLDPYSPDRLLALVAAVGVLAVVLAALGCIGIEPVGKTVEAMSHRAGSVPFAQTLKKTFQNRQARLFFFFVGATLLATLSQDVYLEPYGAKLLHMSVGETARLNMFWGVGTLGALLASGMWLVGRLGRKRATSVGLVIVAFSFGGLILSGAMGSQNMFMMLVGVLGIGSGISGAGAMTLMVDFTKPEQAGLLMGAWTLAHQLAEVAGNIMGGAVIDTVFASSGSYLAAFGTVFGLEILAALLALSLLSRISVATFLSAEPDSVEASYATIA
jgi:BCD family chlorophyll transporter-like MFS transporter